MCNIRMPVISTYDDTDDFELKTNNDRTTPNMWQTYSSESNRRLLRMIFNEKMHNSVHDANSHPLSAGLVFVCVRVWSDVEYCIYFIIAEQSFSIHNATPNQLKMKSTPNQCTELETESSRAGRNCTMVRDDTDCSANKMRVEQIKNKTSQTKTKLTTDIHKASEITTTRMDDDFLSFFFQFVDVRNSSAGRLVHG